MRQAHRAHYLLHFLPSLHPYFNRASLYSARHPTRKDRSLASLRACAPFCNRRGRETKTSSDASQEAPERARKDTPKEVKLQYEGSYPSVRLYKHSFSGFLATRPMSAGRRAARTPLATAYATRYARVIPMIAPRQFPAREICFAAAIRIAPSRLGIIIIPKIRPADGNFAARSLRRRPIRALSTGRSL